ncbi:MAG: preprotein translocase subunit SecG [Nitrospirae bacterium]|nr:preprotein translocase subunit SecG [Nitrospirota bacterium]
MTTLLIIIHAITCLFLISIVLLQGGKGAEIGAAFGGSSQTLFGSRGAATFLSKLTTGAAVLFMLTSLTLSMVSNKHASVIKAVAPAGQSKAIPGQLPQQPLQQPVPQQPIKK